jgi:hypothetical protein
MHAKGEARPRRCETRESSAFVGLNSAHEGELTFGD